MGVGHILQLQPYLVQLNSSQPVSENPGKEGYG